MSEEVKKQGAETETSPSLPPGYVKVERDKSILLWWDSSELWKLLALIFCAGMEFFFFLLWPSGLHPVFLVGNGVMGAVVIIFLILWWHSIRKVHLVWWDCKDGVVRLNGKKYPQDADGLVYEIHARAIGAKIIPCWGRAGWRKVGAPFSGEPECYANIVGSVIRIGEFGALEGVGLTEKVRDILETRFSNYWELQTPYGGEVLRFVLRSKRREDRRVIDVVPQDFHLIQEILESNDYDDFRRRQRCIRQEAGASRKLIADEIERCKVLLSADNSRLKHRIEACERLVRLLEHIRRYGGSFVAIEDIRSYDDLLKDLRARQQRAEEQKGVAKQVAPVATG